MLNIIYTLMIKYQFSVPNPTSQFVKIGLSFQNTYPAKVKLQLPAWRAGRYQIADFAKNIRNLEVKTGSGTLITAKKEAKNIWTFSTEPNVTYHVGYEYYAAKMDAGSSWLDEEQWYLNLVNCCFELLGVKKDTTYSLEFKSSNFPKQICTLPQNKEGIYLAKSFQEVADSTFLAAKNLTHWSYKVGQTKFNLWFHGDIHFNKSTFILQLKSFSERMIKDFGSFPEDSYHFIFQLLPYRHYHGVEHQKGTVITFGPAESLKNTSQMEDLLGVSCHELYHAWNVCRIRPKELLSYDFEKEVYTQAGWILEGITTYMGDIYLLKSGVYSLETYLNHLNRMVKRETIAQGTQSMSILDSSMDLWLDGYELGIPSKKTNIYSHGALIAMSLDILLLERGSSLAEVMQNAWIRFGKNHKGYSQTSFWKIVKSLFYETDEMDEFREKYIFGTGNILTFLKSKLIQLGLEAIPNTEQSEISIQLGVHLNENKITFIHPESPAYSLLMIGDKVSYEISNSHIALDIERFNGNRYQFKIKLEEKSKFQEIKVAGNAQTDLGKKWKE